MEKFTKYIKNNSISIGSIEVSSEVLFINENNKQVGSLILCYIEPGKASVFSVSVLENFRGKGYSKLLMNKAIDTAKKKGCVLIQLNTEVTNEIANNLYKNMGFELKGLMDDFNHYELII